MLIAVFIVCYSFSRIGCYYFVCTSSVFNAIWIDACGIAVFIDLNPKVALMIRFSLPWLHSITLFLYLTCLCSRSGGHFLSHFNRDKAPPYVCFICIYHLWGLPLPEDADTEHPKVKELHELLAWSEGMVWCSPERHGSMSSIFKSQIDWIPLAGGAIGTVANNHEW